MKDQPEPSKPETALTLRQLLGLASSGLFIVGGIQMIGIESQAGDTIFESFFHAMAFVAWGLAAYTLGRLGVGPGRAAQGAREDEELSEQPSE